MQCKTSDGVMNEQSNYNNCLLSTRNEEPDNRLDKIASALTNGFLKFLARFSGKRNLFGECLLKLYSHIYEILQIEQYYQK